MPWFHRGILAVLCRQTDFLLKFGEEEWAKSRGLWDERGLDKIVRHFSWKEEPEDPKCPSNPIFSIKRDSHGRIGAIDLMVSDKMLFIMPRGGAKTTLVNG